jgi:UDP-glucose 4-epimerase
MTILVTGGAGFIGSHLVEHLLERGERVRVLDNFSTGKRENLAGRQGALEILEGDLCQSGTIVRAVQGVELIYHLAALVSVPRSLQDPQGCFEVNVRGTVGLLEAARQAGVAKVVLASSTAVYGNPERFPTPETAPLLPRSPYALSKQVNEQYARLYTQALRLPVVALRFYNVYGPRQRPDSDYAAAIPLFLERVRRGEPLTIYGDGSQSRDFIFVRDVVQACRMAAESHAAGEAYNICTGRETSILDLVEMVQELSRPGAAKPEVRFERARPGDVYRSLGDPARATADFGFQAATTLLDGLVDTLRWMDKP